MKAASLDKFFTPRSIAVIGVSRHAHKVGHVVFKNLFEGGFKGAIYGVNPHAGSVLGKQIYTSVAAIPQSIDLAIIAVPAHYVLSSIKECAAKGTRHVLILTAGFGELGNHDAENELRTYLTKNGIRAIGVNCLGIFDAYNALDALFLPRYRLRRPQAGGIGFVCQSGAIGAAILDIATERHHRFSRFISYGNATDVDESDLLDYLGNDSKTKVICLYMEGIKDGEKFYRTLRRVSKKKPIVALKGGLTKEGSAAALSHTGSLAGAQEVYFGVFNQTGVIRADSLEDMFDIAALIEKNIVPQGGRVQVITNGGGYGIISTDLIASSPHLTLAQLSPSTQKILRAQLPPLIQIRNPLDVLGDATTERYAQALKTCSQDPAIDALLVVVLYQTPLISPDIISVIAKARKQTTKPLIVVSTGSELTERLSHELEDHNVPTFSFPKNALNAFDKVLWYYQKKKTL